MKEEELMEAVYAYLEGYCKDNGHEMMDVSLCAYKGTVEIYKEIDHDEYSHFKCLKQFEVE